MPTNAPEVQDPITLTAHGLKPRRVRANLNPSELIELAVRRGKDNSAIEVH